MIRHIVFFRFLGSVADTERQQFANELRALKGSIPEVLKMEVAFDLAGTPNSYDLSLNSLFDSMETVSTYAVHPEHMKILDRVKLLCQSVAKVDYEAAD